MDQQARYCVWPKRKSDLIDRHGILAPPAAMNPYGDSWEEQAFAEDTARSIGGGCVWPPRSYSCTFCRREFRSAQALGGHMNVHRRDRARLKQQSPVPDRTEAVTLPHDHLPNHCPSFLYNNPNTKLSDCDSWISSPSDVLRVSSPDAKFNRVETISGVCFFSPLVQKFDKDSSLLLPGSWSSSVGQKRDGVLDSTKDEEKRSVVTPTDSTAEKEDSVTDDFSTSLSLVMRNSSSEEEVGSCKKRRVFNEAKQPLRFFPNLCAVDHDTCCLPQSEQVVDLELRLGDAPKVK